MPPAWPTGGSMRPRRHCSHSRRPPSPATMTVLTSSRVCRLSLSILCSVRSPQGCRKAHSMPWIQTYLSRDDLKYHSAHQAGTSCNGWSPQAAEGRPAYGAVVISSASTAALLPVTMDISMQTGCSQEQVSTQTTGAGRHQTDSTPV